MTTEEPQIVTIIVVGTALVAAGYPLAYGFYKYIGKSAVREHIVSRHDKTFGDLIRTQTEHVVKISHLEQAIEKHDARISSLESPRILP
jgi:hypothetical protein